MDKETETARPEAQVTPGRLLKEKRESIGLSVEQVADRLRLRATIVESLEADNFNIDKVATFTRGYVRSYARLIGVDEKLILSSFDQYSELDKPEAVPMKSFSRKTTKEQHNSRINFLTFFIIVIVIGISSIWWYQNKQQDSLRPDSLPENNSAVSANSDADNAQSEFDSIDAESQSVGDDVENNSADDAATSSMSSDDTAGNDEDASITASDDTDPNESTAVDTSSVSSVSDGSSESTEQPADNTTASLSQLTMKFEKDCWIQVKDAAGNTLAVGLKKAGHSFNLEGETPISVVLGAPEGVSVTFAGEPVDLSRYTSGKVARFTLP